MRNDVIDGRILEGGKFHTYNDGNNNQNIDKINGSPSVLPDGNVLVPSHVRLATKYPPYI